MVAAVHVLARATRAGDWTALRQRVRPQTMAAEGVLHDLGVIAMLSSDSQGMGRVGEVFRRALQNADAMKARARRRGRAGRQRARAAPPRQGHDQPGDHARAGARTWARSKSASSPTPCCGGRSSPACGPSSCSRAGMSAWGASGDGNATTMLRRAGAGAAPDRRRGRGGGAALARVHGARGARRGAADDAAARAVEGCRELTAADMVRNDRTGTVRVDRAARGDAGRRAGRAPPVERVAFSDRFLLG